MKLASWKHNFADSSFWNDKPAVSSIEYRKQERAVKCLIWVRSDKENLQPSLRERIQFAFDHPELVRRFGCLFLGESDQLIKSIKLVSEDYLQGVRHWVIRDNRGGLTLPYWVDHVGSRNTRFLRYRIEEMPILALCR